MSQADLFDTGLKAAEHLVKFKCLQASVAFAGVVLERHFGQVCAEHKIPITKKNSTIAVFNDALKAADVIDLPQWRFVQHLADIRNMCNHAKEPEPNAEQIADLLTGVNKVLKTIM